MALWRMNLLSKECRPEMDNDEASNSKKQEDDPKALLDGLSVASLVSLLRQFGDLSQYAAEVFHGLQEEMSTTASRSRELMARMKRVEAALPPLETDMLSETSHVQFAYTPGSEWHACIRDEQNHFIYTDLPHRIMDSYEECREPPRLQLLDKFDPGGPGSCLTRYSDPTFFRKVSTNSETLNDVKSNRVRKKRRAWKSSCQLPYDASNFNSTCSPRQLRQSSPTQTALAFDNAFKFDFEDQSDSLGSGDWMGLNEGVPCSSVSVKGDKTKTKQLYSGSGDELIHNLENHGDSTNLMIEKSGGDSSIFTWDGKVETAEPMILNYRMHELPSSHETSSEFGRPGIEPRMWMVGNDEAQEVTETKVFVTNQPDEAESETENFVDALNSIESECENDLDCQTKADAKDDLEDSSQRTSASRDTSGRELSESPECSKSSTHPSEYALWQNIHSSLVQHVGKADGLQQNSDGVNVNDSTSTTVDPWYQHLGSLANCSSYDNGNTNFRQPTLDSDHHEFDYYKKLGLDRNLNNSVLSAHSRTQLVPTTIPPEAKAHRSRSQIDGFRRTRSMEYNEKPKEVYSEKIRDHENATSCMTSAPASPPLDHMNISFQPINSFKTTKLKLNLPKGTDHHSETLDAFPSFQLVPEPNLQPQFNSDTDDDTFCRSKPCISDDDISHHYGPNSELWESPDSSESGDHTPCNAFYRTSSGGSNSSSVEHEHTTTRNIHNGSIPLPDIPLLQAMNPFVLQETDIQSYQKALAEPFDLRELTPALPPLPPLQWRVTEPHSVALEGKESALGVTGVVSDSKGHGSMFPHPTKPAPDVRMNAGTDPMNAALRSKQLDEQKVKVNVKNKTYQSANQRGVDEREDFLHQIRTKSFNLRKTGLLKPTSPTLVAPVTNGKVAAILEKAKTIRQVMTSDDDDHWSDT